MNCMALFALTILAAASAAAEPQAAATHAGATRSRQLDSYEYWQTLDADALVEEVRDFIAEDWLIDPPGESARDVLKVLRQRFPDHPQLQELTHDLYDEMLRRGKAALRAKAFARSAQWLEAAREVGAGLYDSELVFLEAELADTRKKYPDPYLVN